MSYFPKQLFLAMMIVILATPSISYAFKGDRIQEDREVIWNGRVWILVYPHSRNSGRDRTWNFELLSYEPGAAGKPRQETVITLPEHVAWLLAGQDGLWIICSSAISYYKDGKTNLHEVNNSLGDISAPFIYKEKPSIIEQRNGEFVLRSFQHNRWVDEDKFGVQCENNCEYVSDYLQVISISGQLHFFVQNNNGLFYHKGIPEKYDSYPEKWERIYKTSKLSYWTATDFSGSPTVFYYVNHGIMGRMHGYIKESGRWALFYTGPKRILTDAYNTFGIYPTGRGKDFVLLRKSTFGRTYGINVIDGKEHAGFYIGTLAFEPFMVLTIISLLIMVIFISIVSVKAPFWWFSFGVSAYRETRTFTREQIKINSFMQKDYSDAKSYDIKKWPEYSAISFKLKFTAGMTRKSPMQPISSAVVLFEEKNGELIVTIDSKSPSIFVFLPLILLLIPMFQKSIEVFPPLIGSFMFFLIIVVIAAQVYAAHYSIKKKCKEFFPHLWLYLGIDKALEIESPI